MAVTGYQGPPRVAARLAREQGSVWGSESAQAQEWAREPVQVRGSGLALASAAALA